MTKNALAAAPIDQKLQYLETVVREALDVIGAASLVGVVVLGEDSRVAFRMPGCPSDCKDSKVCTANIFHEAGHDLIDNAHDIESGVAKLLDNGENKKM